MGRSSRSPSRKKSSRRRSPSRSRSRHSKKNRHRSPEKKSSKYRRSDSSSDTSTSRYKSSSSKYKNKRHKKRDSRSPSNHRRRYRRSSSSSSNSSSRSRDTSRNSSRSSSPDKLHKNKPSSSYADKIRAMRTPTPPRITQTVNLDFLDERPVSDAIDEINADKFVQKTFNSSANDAKPDKDTDVVKAKIEPRINKVNVDDDPLFHKNVCVHYITKFNHSFFFLNKINFHLKLHFIELQVFGDNDERMERWIKKAFSYRQKMFGASN